MTAKQIKESLLKQLKTKGANVEHFTSLVDDYVFYWQKEREMQKDIKEKGMQYESISASGKKYMKDNPSVKNSVMYNKQKLSILKELNLNTNNCSSGEDDEL